MILFMQVQVLFYVDFFICSINISYVIFLMKSATSFHKYKLFPYATTMKKPTQQWNHLLKLSPQKKRLFKSKARFFSMEFGRSLPKRIFWQIAQTGFKKDNSFLTNSFQIPQTRFKKDKNNTLLPKVSTFTKFSHSWSVFRSLFFGKMWMLNNPALVPGVVWPVKSKKIRMAKMRAFKALCHLTGKGNLSFVVSQAQKLWASTNRTKPSLWFLASSMDSLKANYLMKSGFVPTIYTGHHWVSYGNILHNGFLDKKSMRFYYPGDFVQITKENSLTAFFNSGPRYQSLPTSQKNGVSVYSTTAFLWLSPFFQKKISPFFKTKKSSFYASKKLKYTGFPKKYNKNIQ